jgi:hypothetical protein
MPKETGGLSDVELANALQVYLRALEEFELAAMSGHQRTINRASEKISQTLQQLALRKEQFERGEAQNIVD